jgi:hypothetical protein
MCIMQQVFLIYNYGELAKNKEYDTPAGVFMYICILLQLRSQPLRLLAFNTQ